MQEGFIEIALDWGDGPRPEEACYLFYDVNGKLVKEVTGVTDCFKGTLPAGIYHLVMHNNDAQRVGYRGMEHHETAEVFAQEKQIGKGSTNELQVLEPEVVYGTSCCQGFGKLVVENGKITNKTACPVRLTKQVLFQFKVMNASEVESLTGRLNGVIPSLFIASGKSNFSHVAAISFTGVLNETNTYAININVFDLLSSEQPQPEANTMDIALVADGKQYEFSTDLTETLEEIMNENEGVIPVEIPIEVEITIKEINGGITAKVKPWDNSGSGNGNPRPKSSNRTNK